MDIATMKDQSTEQASSETQPTLLAVLAHPDDESFGMGGTLALYARRGAAVHLITATRGEAGTVDPRHLSEGISIAELRSEHELHCAAEILGLAGVHILGYRDSGMPGSPDNEHPQALVAQPAEEVAGRIAEIIRQVRPQVVVTHDPIGGYRHPDHIAVHDATVLAFNQLLEPASAAQADGYRPQKLYFNTFQTGFFRWVVRLVRLFGRDPRRWGRNQDIDVVALAEGPHFPVHALIRYDSVRSQKEAAAACHASQLESGPPQRGPLFWITRLYGARDQFMRAYPEAEAGLKEDDLFAGVDLRLPERRQAPAG
jgi:LmbE family N-acetylglucosaminyl deacetylase